jgi:N6-adenosine-specific RNA methylase IME4
MMYRVLLADPPWQYNDKLTMSDTKRSSDAHYPTMTFAEIERFKIPEMKEDSFLFLWVTNPFLLDGSGPDVCEAWGFKPKQLITWVKGRDECDKTTLHIGMGHYTRSATEHVIVGVRGKPKWLIKNRGVPNIFVAPREQHSAKPECFYKTIEDLVDGPYMELFARKRRDGWDAEGNELCPTT